MSKRRLSLGVLLAAALAAASASGQQPRDPLFELFRNPTAEARPFVRWWWCGDRVTEPEILRELDLMKAAGLGGVEINPIAMPVTPDRPIGKPLPWLSPEWNRAVAAAADKAKANGMKADLIVGSGWPFGGRFLKPGEMIQRILTVPKELTGPAVVHTTARALLDEVPEGYDKEDHKNVVADRLVFLRLYPETAARAEDGLDILPAVGADGAIRIDVPPGRHVLLAGVWQEGHQHVTLGAPGSDGPVLDHLNAVAVRKYLDRLSGALEGEFGGRLGTRLRALFCDSIEVAGNWTTDFAARFKERNGYACEPYLPFLFAVPNRGFRDLVAFTPAFADEIKRVRYDTCRTFVELFLERFVGTFKAWCEAHGVLCRYQAYGAPNFVGMPEGYLIPDIPESNNWLYSDPEKHGFLIWNKYASSGGHISGRPIVSCEAMTNLAGVFKTTLETVKRADDLNFLTGITHSVLHGYSYSPPEAGFPGWTRYGAYFNEKNTWWPYFSLWATANARLSAVFQAARPKAEIAVLAPTADVWSEKGLWRIPFHETPWYVHQLWKTFSAAGATADYVHEGILRTATCADGRIAMGKMTYDLLVLCGVATLHPETARRIGELVSAGAKVAFVGGALPVRSPSLANAAENDRIVARSLAAAAAAHPSRARMIAEPAGRDGLLDWTRRFLATMGVDPAVAVSRPDPDLYQIHLRDGGRDLVFFGNQSPDREMRFSVDVPGSRGIPWRWDPETGERHPLPGAKSAQGYPLALAPLESALIVFDAETRPAAPAPERFDASDPSPVSAPWHLALRPRFGTPFELDLPAPIDLGASPDPRLNAFAGTIEYATTLDLPSDGAFALDLGRVEGVTEASLNGVPLGTRWYGRHRYDLRGAARPGRNALRIVFTSTLFNYCRTQGGANPDIKFWLRSGTDPVPSGILGPVRLFSLTRGSD